MGKHEFLIRRLHSLSGLIPVGAYMVVHLLTNASILNSEARFQNTVYLIHSLGPILPLVEWGFIFIPLLFHTIIGVLIVRSGESNSAQYKYASNYRYTLQRATGMIAMLFILWHVFHMHGWFHFEAWTKNVAEPLGGYKFRPYNAASTAAGALQSGIVVVVYAIGVLSCVFHLANGIWTMGITWGVWISPAAQSRASKVCVAFGVGLAIVGMSSLVGFNQLDVDKARQVEDRMYDVQVKAGLVEEDDHKRVSTTHAKD